MIWDNKTGETLSYRTNQGLPVRVTFDNECEPMKEIKVKPMLYTPESMACGGEVEQPDTELNDEKPEDTDDAESTDNDNSAKEQSDDNFEDETLGCSCSFLKV